MEVLEWLKDIGLSYHEKTEDLGKISSATEVEVGEHTGLTLYACISLLSQGFRVG